jgi:hypothetical protein
MVTIPGFSTFFLPSLYVGKYVTVFHAREMDRSESKV